MTPEPSAAEIYGRDFPAGAVIFEEGDPGSRMYVIQSGAVQIVKRVVSRTITLAHLGPGEAFGEMALLEGRPRSATAVVEAPGRILELDEAAFADLVVNERAVSDVVAKYEAEARFRRLSGAPAVAVSAIAVFLSLFQLYTAGTGPLEALKQRSLHLTLVLVLAFLLYPARRGAPKARPFCDPHRRATFRT